jgi:beta-galactosidase
VHRGPSPPGGYISQGYLPYGVAWYRKSFELPASAKGQAKYLDFDGVMISSQVWLNGYFLGNHSSGYTPFRFELRDTDLNWGGKNILAVRADASALADAWQDSWYYDGGGIYRHVRLTVTPPLHIAPWGVYAPALVTAASINHAADGRDTAHAVLNASVDIANHQATTAVGVHITATVIDARGSMVGTSQSQALSVPAGSGSMETPYTVALPPISMASATLWSVDTPVLYTLVTTVSPGGDSVNTTFGVRLARFDPDHGFLLNERPLKIKGACNHQDFAGVGVAVPDALQDFRVSKMKSTGINGCEYGCSPNGRCCS